MKALLVISSPALCQHFLMVHLAIAEHCLFHIYASILVSLSSDQYLWCFFLQLQDELLGMSRRLSSAEANLAATSECLALNKRLSVRLADSDARGAELAGKVCTCHG